METYQLKCLNCEKDFNTVRKISKFCCQTCSNIYYAKLRTSSSTKKKVCKVCKKEKTFRFFSYVKKNYKLGHMDICKNCGRNEKLKLNREKTWKHDARLSMFNNSKQRAKNANMEFSLTKEDIIIPDFCPVLGIKLETEKRDKWINAPSIDRIDNNKGYIKENIVIVSKRANVLKKDASIQELILISEFYKQFLKKEE